MSHKKIKKCIKLGKSAVNTVTKSMGDGWVIKIDDPDILKKAKTLLKDEGVKIVEMSKEEYESGSLEDLEKKMPVKIKTSSIKCNYTVTELRKMAQEKNIVGRSKMSKDELCKVLNL